MLSSCCISCAQPQIQNDFYWGLINKAEPQNNDDAEHSAQGFFEKALNSPNVYIRRAAADELAKMMYEGAVFSAATTEKIRREAEGSWAAAFEAVGAAPASGQVPDKEKALALLLSSPQDAVPNEAMVYTLRECINHEEAFFSEPESAAIEGHFAVSRSRYNEALFFFRVFQEDGKWPEQIPPLFIQYPVLINDLGRAFQYTSSGSEGIDLFLQWEKGLDGGLRFRLLFYAGRIARRRGLSAQGLFEQAQPLAPENKQADACIWYILDAELNVSSDETIRRLEQYIPLWRDGAYFDDILEKLSRELASKREWKNLIRVFTQIRDRGAAVSTARYAWIIGRAIEEGFLNDGEKQLAREAANVTTEEPASAFMHIAYEAGDTSLYYRSVSAAALNEPFLALAEGTPAVGKTVGKSSADSAAGRLEFLLGFFSNNVSEFALPYIKSMEKELIPDELRTLAEALGNAGMYAESMRLVSLYINRKDYKPDRRDMELFFPRPYRELAEKFASETNIDPALLYGLIRTESAFQSSVVSSAGAVGLTQLMPATAEETAGRIRRAGGPDYAASDNGGLDLNDPGVNIHIGAYYLNYLMGRFENTLLSLLAYNGGMNRIRRWSAANTMPPDLFLETIAFRETREYGRKVMAAAAVYRELYY